MSDLKVEPLGEREVTLRIIYNDKADLVAKLNGVAAEIDNVAGKPIWLADIRFNCCGGSPP